MWLNGEAKIKILWAMTFYWLATASMNEPSVALASWLFTWNTFSDQRKML